MADFALVVCANGMDQPVTKTRFTTELFKKISSIFKKQNTGEWVRKIELYDDLNIYLVRLPYCIDELKALNLNKLKKTISETCNIFGLNHCFLPVRLLDILKSERFNDRLYDGKLLYKSLLYNILEEIYSKTGRGLGDLDIAVVQGENLEELYMFIRLLSPLVKYITVLARDKSMIEDEINKIYIDSGLSIGLTSDYRNGLKNSDVVINLGSLNEFALSPGINTKALVINYGDREMAKMFDKSILVNGIEVRLPQNIQRKIDRDVFESFNSLEISEMVLLNRLVENADILDFTDAGLMELLSSEFKKGGFKITGLIGRHSTLKPEELRVCS